MSKTLYERVAGRLGTGRTEGRRYRGARDIDLEVSRQRSHHGPSHGGLPSAGTSLSRIRLH